MRITHGYSNVGLGLGTTGSTAASRGSAVGANDSTQGTGDTGAQGGAFRVTLSARARELSDAGPSAGPDAAKVSTLRASMQGGALAINSAQIAQGIVSGE